MQQPLSEKEKEDALERLKHHHPENNKCFDCGKGHPTWASVNLGILLCMNCAGHHREYGVQYSFTHSFQLDSWTPRQLLFLELGGNAHAHEHFKKHGLKPPYDYKSSVIQNYKNELTKKVDAAVKAQIVKDQEAQYTKGISMSLSNLDHFHHDEGHASPSAKKKEEHISNPMSASLDNLDKVKPKVEFSHSGRNSSSKKGGLSARRIDDIDINSLTLDDESNKFFETEMANHESGIKEVKSNGNSAEKDRNKFDSLRDAKGISSDLFKDKENQNVTNQASDSKAKGDEKKTTNPQDSKGILSQIGGKVGGGIASLGGNISSLGGALKFKVGNILQKKKQKENIE